MIKLNFLKPEVQMECHRIFKDVVKDEKLMDERTAKRLLRHSKLSEQDITYAWILADTTKSGRLFFPEFALAFYICKSKKAKHDLRNTLKATRAEVRSMVNAISFGVVMGWN